MSLSKFAVLMCGLTFWAVATIWLALLVLAREMTENLAPASGLSSTAKGLGLGFEPPYGFRGRG